MHSRPDLSGLPADVIAYIEALEQQLEARAAEPPARTEPTRAEAVFEPSEPPTTAHVITISAAGLAKRTPRHLYGRQRRGGMGIFDLESPDNDPPAFLLVADERDTLILITDHGRAFPLAVQGIAATPIRSRGQSITERLPLRPDEHLALVIPDQQGAFLCLVSRRGQVRRIAAHFLGRNLNAGAVIHDPREGGSPAAAGWSSGSDELLIATVQGRAIRFPERLVPVRGCLGLRVEPSDRVAAVAAAPAGGSVFMLTDDGKGALRALDTFAANKSPGSGGKTLMKTDALVAAMGVTSAHDLFLLSRLGKLIRFQADDVPPKEGPVQGVNCMTLRADACVAAAAAQIVTTAASASPDALADALPDASSAAQSFAN